MVGPKSKEVREGGKVNSVFYQKCYWGNGMGRACRTGDRDDKCIQNDGRKIRREGGRGLLEDLGLK